MRLDRALAHMKVAGDGPVRLTLPKALQNLEFARREFRRFQSFRPSLAIIRQYGPLNVRCALIFPAYSPSHLATALLLLVLRRGVSQRIRLVRGAAKKN
jgi:hypothetical protein